MRTLLSKSHLRQLKIIDILDKIPSMTLKNLSNIINSNQKTLRQDIKELNILIAPNSIETSPQFGLILVLNYETSIESIYSLFLSRSIEFQIIENIFLKKSKTIDSLADSLFISTSTLRRIVSTLNNQLKSIHFKIDLLKLDLIGDESQIRNFMIHYLEEKYRDSNLVFPKNQLEMLDKLFEFVLHEENRIPNYPDIEKLRIWIMVILIRVQHGHQKQFKKKDFNKIPEFFVANSNINRLFKATFSITLTKNILLQIFYVFFNNNYCQNISDLNNLAKTHTHTAEFVRSLNLLLINISKTLSINLERKDDLVLNLYNLDSLYVGNTYVLYNKNQAFIESLTNDYSNFYQFVKNEIDSEPFLKKKNWSQDAINHFFYMLITHWPDLAHEIERNTTIFSAALFFNTDLEHIQMIKDKLSYVFQNKFSFTIIDVLTINDLQNQQKTYDILLTNLFNIKIDGTLIIAFPLAVHASDLKKIDDAYGELLQKSKNI